MVLLRQNGWLVANLRKLFQNNHQPKKTLNHHYKQLKLITTVNLSKIEQEALNAWLTIRQNLLERQQVDLELMKRKDDLMNQLDPNSPVFAHIKLLQS
jgi:biopolymer transport protein ExbB/TolQ